MSPGSGLHPADDLGPLLTAAVAVGVVVLTVSHVYGIVNRWREAGPAAALYSQTGVAGLTTLLGLGLGALGVAASASAVV